MELFGSLCNILIGKCYDISSILRIAAPAVAASLSVFHSRLKTHLFRCCIPWLHTPYLLCPRSDTVILEHLNHSCYLLTSCTNSVLNTLTLLFRHQQIHLAAVNTGTAAAVSEVTCSSQPKKTWCVTSVYVAMIMWMMMVKWWYDINVDSCKLVHFCVTEKRVTASAVDSNGGAAASRRNWFPATVASHTCKHAFISYISLLSLTALPV